MLTVTNDNGFDFFCHKLNTKEFRGPSQNKDNKPSRCAIEPEIQSCRPIRQSDEIKLMRFRHLDGIEKFKLISWETNPFQSV